MLGAVDGAAAEADGAFVPGGVVAAGAAVPVGAVGAVDPEAAAGASVPEELFVESDDWPQAMVEAPKMQTNKAIKARRDIMFYLPNFLIILLELLVKQKNSFLLP